MMDLPSAMGPKGQARLWLSLTSSKDPALLDCSLIPQPQKIPNDGHLLFHSHAQVLTLLI